MVGAYTPFETEGLDHDEILTCRCRVSGSGDKLHPPTINSEVIPMIKTSLLGIDNSRLKNRICLSFRILTLNPLSIYRRMIHYCLVGVALYASDYDKNT